MGGSAERVDMVIEGMKKMGKPNDITFEFEGFVASTVSAHRLLQNVQEKEGPAVSYRLLGVLYREYFEQGKNPAAIETLLEAAQEIGLNKSEIQKFLESNDGERDLKNQFQRACKCLLQT